MEWMTVVWCLPPKARPISGSEASVSSLTRYMATCRGIHDLLRIALFLELRLLHLELLRDRFLDRVDGHLAVLHMNQVLQNLLRHLQVIGVPVSEE